jgi:hypothetical protein
MWMLLNAFDCRASCVSTAPFGWPQHPHGPGAARAPGREYDHGLHACVEPRTRGGPRPVRRKQMLPDGLRRHPERWIIEIKPGMRLKWAADGQAGHGLCRSV